VTPDAIRAELKAQITAPVRWQQGVEVMYGAGVDRFIEFGPGKVLTGMIKRTVSGVVLENVAA
jgi:[acyl-carrier-protein] S-malonyltransferase